MPDLKKAPTEDKTPKQAISSVPAGQYRTVGVRYRSCRQFRAKQTKPKR